MNIIVSNQIQLNDVSSNLLKEVTSRLTFQNPKWIENDRMGRWNGGTPEYLSCYERTPKGLIIPRGFARQLIGLCKRHGVPYRIEDRRRTLPDVSFEFKGILRAFQEVGAKDVLTRDFGTLSAPTGSGKTVVGLYLIAKRRQPALVICHTKELLYQWHARAVEFLDVQEDEIGLIGDGKKTIGERLTIGIVNSVYKLADEIWKHVGHLIVDECHRTPSKTFTEAVSAFDSRFMLGLSATPWRRDKLSRLIYWHLGDLVHEVDREALQEQGHILKAYIVLRETEFITRVDPSEQYSQMLSELTQDPTRNALIAEDVARAAGNGGGTCLVLSDRKEHCQILSTLLSAYGVSASVLTGNTGKADREAIVDRLNKGGIKALCATGQLIGEGFDCKQLSTLFLATPIRFNGRVLQYLGRVLRPAPGKDRAIVYDYCDVKVPVLKASAKARERVFQKEDYHATS